MQEGDRMSVRVRPISKSSKKQSGKTKRRAVNILLNDATPFHVREAYKALRTNVMFSIAGSDGKVIGITSAVPGEGKSSTIMNLAITFAEIGKKVILLDCDLRRPNLLRITNAKPGPGIAEVLAKFTGLDDVIRQTDYAKLDVIYSGDIPPNPAELLGSKNMESLIEELKDRYDYILIDTPPVNIVTDGAVLSRLMDGLIIVARENFSRRDELLYAVNSLKFVNAKVIGTVLNDKAFQAKRSYRYSKYKSYYVRDYAEDTLD